MTRNRIVRLIMLAVFIGFAGFGAQARGSKLDCVRQAVGSGDSDGNDSASDSDYHDDDDSYGCRKCNSKVNLWWTCLVPPIGLFICLPLALLESEDDRVTRAWHQDWIPAAYFVSRPYADGHRGLLLSTERFRYLTPVILEDTHERLTVYDPGAEVLNQQHLAKWSFRFSAEWAYDYDPVHRPNLSASIDSIYRFGLFTRWTHYIEPLGDGEFDQITIGDVNLTGRFAQNEIAQVRLGLGYRMIHDGQVSSGVNLVYLVDVFPVDPLVISLEGNIGNLGMALYLHGRLTLGAQLGPVEPYLGYDAVLISSTSVAVLFQGPVAGMRIWF